MNPLLRSEVRRFRAAATAGSLAHTALLIATSGLGALVPPTATTRAIGLFACALLGLLLGVFQLGSYRRRPGSWSYLVHRPLSPARVFLSLAGAASVVLTAVVALPLFVVALALRLGGAGADTRYLLMAPFLLGVALAFYLAGAFLVLCESRARFLVLLLPGLFLYPRPAPIAAFATLALVLGWLLLLALAAFKPDLSTPLARPLAVAAFAAPVQLGLTWALSFVLLFAYSTGVAVSVAGWRNFADFAWNDYFPEGTLHRTDYQEAGDALAIGLRLSGSDRARALLAGLDRDAVQEVVPGLPSPPRRGQLPLLDRDQTFEDEARGVAFTFSHDRMLFAGRVLRTGDPAGWLGTNGRAATVAEAAPFESVPVAAGRWITTERRIYELSPKEPAVRARFDLPAGERLVTPFGEKDRDLLLALTDRALYLVEPWSAEPDPGVVPAKVRIPLPGDVRNLTRAVVASGEGGLLVSFILGARSERELGEARQVVFELDLEDKAHLLVDLPLGQGPPAWVRHRTFVVSPLLSALDDVAFWWSGPRRLSRVTPADLLSAPPRAALAPALLLALLSSALTAWSARGRALSPGARVAWIAAALLTSLPGYLGFLLLTPRADRADPPSG